MDRELQHQMNLFKKKALSTPSVSLKPSKADSGDSKKRKHDKSKPKKHHHKRQKFDSADGAGPSFDYKTTQASMSANFGVLARIVDHMKKRFLGDQATWGLDIGEILEEIQLFDLSSKSKEWLLQALPSNPKIFLDAQNKFQYKPPLKVKGKVTLHKLLQKYDQEGKGGILLSELSESVANADKIVESLVAENKAKCFATLVNKRKDKVVFFYESEGELKVDDEFVQLWRTIPIENLDEQKIEEYLVKHRITCMADGSSKKQMAANQGAKQRKARQRKNVIIHNEHLGEILQDFSSKST